MIDKVLLLVKDEFMKNQIKITVNEIQTFTLIGVENEFKHLILNIINNAKDAFIDNNIEKREILINILFDEKSKKVELCDNAGGIPTHIIDDIFKANFTTKEEGKGTGIGLYMSSQIATKYHGTLSVENINNGAKFTFEQLN
jgi:C4-dicarboxylate-specific signal transduction histidine kinase